jgi:hypothetical protein
LSNDIKEKNEMKSILPVSATLAMILGVFSLHAAGQTSPAAMPAPATDNIDVAANFTYKVAKIASTTTNFVMPGGSLDAAYNFGGKAGGLSLVGDANFEEKSSIEPGVNLRQFSVMGGARYTFRFAKYNPHGFDLYGQILGGEVFASHSLFPYPSGATTSASSGAFQAGGGANLRLTHSIALRLVGVDFVSTSLPNSTNNRQYDVRFENGVVFRF